MLINYKNKRRQGNVKYYRESFKLTWSSWWLSVGFSHRIWMASLILSWKVVEAWSMMLKPSLEHKVRQCARNVREMCKKCARTYHWKCAHVLAWKNAGWFRRHSIIFCYSWNGNKLRGIALALDEPKPDEESGGCAPKTRIPCGAGGRVARSIPSGGLE